MSRDKTSSLADIDKYILGEGNDDIKPKSETIAKLIEYRRRFLQITGTARQNLNETKVTAKDRFKCSQENESSLLTPVPTTQHRLCDTKYAVAITVIVPVYNTSFYLEKCLDSILAQTFKSFEVVCVDDASTDDSWAKLKAYAAQDGRIRIVQHEKNLGLGGARNTALKLARGEYVASVDSDDYIAKDMLEVLYNAAQTEGACIVVCGFQRVREDGALLKAQRFQRKNIINDNNSIDIFSTCNPAFWNKLWRTDLFTGNEIFFPDYVFYQDLATTPRILSRAKKITFISDCPYFYLIREGSATYSHTAKHVVDYFTVFGILRQFLYENGLYARYEMGFNTALIRACKFRSENIQKSTLGDQEKRRHLSHMLAIYHYFLNVAPVTDNFSITQCLASFNENSHIKPGLELPLSIMVKTICRPDLIERFLESAGAYQRARQQKFAEILVGDDSPKNYQNLNADAIARVAKRFPELRIRHLVFEYDIGCSAGRNRMVEAAISENILQCDDDFILDEACDIGLALTLFDAKKVDIMGGWLKNKYDILTGEYEYRAALGFFSREDDTIKLEVNEDKYNIPDFSECEFIMNFFIAKRQALLENAWDHELKTEEHHEFFYRASRNGLGISFSKLLFAKHTYEKPNNSADYNAHRFDKSRWRKYLFLSVQKCDATIRIIETRKVDKIIKWEVNLRKKTTIENVVNISI